MTQLQPNHRYKLLCIGEPIIDYFIDESQYPEHSFHCYRGVIQSSRKELKAIIKDVPPKNTFAGGSAFNTARWFAQKNTNCSFFGPLSNDPEAKQLIQSMRDHGVENNCFVNTQYSSQVCTIIHPNKERSFIFTTSLNGSFPLPSQSLLQSAKIIHLEGYMLRYPAQTLELIQNLPPSTLLSFDLGSWNLLQDNISLFESILRRANLVFGNRKEFSILSSSVDQYITSITKADRIAICTDSDKSITIGSSKGLSKHSIEKIDVIDSTGAGDAFSGGFLAGYVDSLSLSEAISCGCKCAKKTLMQVGAEPCT